LHHADVVHAGNCLDEQFNDLAIQIVRDVADAGDVSAWSRQD
jgi:hypothetical protein